MSSSSFNPLLFSDTSDISFDTSFDTFSNKTLDQSSGALTISGKKPDIEKFDQLCWKFRKIPHIKIKSLKGCDRKDFNLVVSYIHVLASTPDYAYFYDRVTKYFADLKDIVPGTVGSYFAGCLIKTSFADEGCTPVCAGSIPKPKDEEGWAFCDKTVIFAEYTKHRGYNFTLLRESDNQENDIDLSYVFVDSTDEFGGFSEKEKKRLNQMGASNIQVIGCDDTDTGNETKYIELEKGQVFDLKHRKKEEIVTDNSRLALAILLIVLILIIIFLFFGATF